MEQDSRIIMYFDKNLNRNWIKCNSVTNIWEIRWLSSCTDSRSIGAQTHMWGGKARWQRRSRRWFPDGSAAVGVSVQGEVLPSVELLVTLKSTRRAPMFVLWMQSKHCGVQRAYEAIKFRRVFWGQTEKVNKARATGEVWVRGVMSGVMWKYRLQQTFYVEKVDVL